MAASGNAGKNNNQQTDNHESRLDQSAINKCAQLKIRSLGAKPRSRLARPPRAPHVSRASCSDAIDLESPRAVRESTRCSRPHPRRRFAPRRAHPARPQRLREAGRFGARRRVPSRRARVSPSRRASSDSRTPASHRAIASPGAPSAPSIRVVDPPVRRRRRRRPDLRLRGGRGGREGTPDASTSTLRRTHRLHPDLLLLHPQSLPRARPRPRSRRLRRRHQPRTRRWVLGRVPGGESRPRGRGGRSSPTRTSGAARGRQERPTHAVGVAARRRLARCRRLASTSR